MTLSSPGLTISLWAFRPACPESRYPPNSLTEIAHLPNCDLSRRAIDSADANDIFAEDASQTRNAFSDVTGIKPQPPHLLFQLESHFKYLSWRTLETQHVQLVPMAPFMEYSLFSGLQCFDSNLKNRREITAPCWISNFSVAFHFPGRWWYWGSFSGLDLAVL
jgi:hypothetical protein